MKYIKISEILPKIEFTNNLLYGVSTTHANCTMSHIQFLSLRVNAHWGVHSQDISVLYRDL